MWRWLKLRWMLSNLPACHDYAVVADWPDGRLTVTGAPLLEDALDIMNDMFHEQGATEVHVWARPPRPYSWKKG